MAQYKCLKSNFKELTKKINRIGKKLDRNNLKWNFEKVAESIEEVKMYSTIEKLENKKTTLVEVVTYNFEMEDLKIGEYEAIAVIDHTSLLGNENLIYTIKEGITISEKYRNIESICEHCNIRRKRNKTVLLQNKEGKIIQVGTTCIRDFTGIEATDVIKNYEDIHNIILNYNDLERSNDYDIENNKFTNTKKYLANCIKIIEKDGYKKDDTKTMAWENIHYEEVENENLEKAEKVINYFKNKEVKNNEFLNNIKASLKSEYTRKSGFIAYAYVSYKKEIEKENKKLENQKSGYIGNVKERIQIEVTLLNVYSYETEYGSMHINLYKDKQGNIYKWSSKNMIQTEEGEFKTIKGTVKAHEEYNGQKQTVITRCKLV